MTNEEKAKEIGEVCECCMDGKIHCDECEGRAAYLGALEMAAWKDQQFKEYLEKKKGSIGFRSDWLGFFYDVCSDLIDEIINELFKED